MMRLGIYSILKFVIQQASQLNIKTPCITFDQPLFLKAFEISQSKKLPIIIRLGDFHTLMSFLGNVGMVMDSSGLREVMETVYASNTVTHMLSGKAYARAIRCHFLIETSLMLVNLLSYHLPSSTNNSTIITTENLNSLKSLYNNLLENPEQLTDIITDENNVLNKLSSVIQQYQEDLSNSSRTAKLWIRYLNYVRLMKDFIWAERTGDWKSHLSTVRRMLNLFAALDT